MLTHADIKPHKCEICGKPFTQADDLKRHMLTHADKKPHMLTHTGERPDNYDICGKQKQKTDTKSHPCDECGKQFTHVEYLRKHMVIHINEKSYKCKFCVMQFSQPQELQHTS